MSACPSDSDAKLDMLLKSHESMQQTLTRLTDAVARLALIEDRQTAATKAVENVASDLKKTEDRLRLLEKAVPNELDRRLCDLEKRQTLHSMSSSGFFKVAAAICMLVVGALVSSILKG